MRPSERLRAEQRRLEEFRDAFTELLATVQRVDTGFSTYELRPAEGRLQEFNRAATVCARTAGAASAAQAKHGGLLMTGGGGRTLTLNPVGNWQIVLEQPWRLSPQAVFGAVEASIGAAQALAEDATAHESGFIGLIARFVRIPYEVREAVGHGPVLGAAALTGGVLVQIMIAGLGGVLTFVLVLLGAHAYDAVTHPPTSHPAPTTTRAPSP